MVMTCQHCEAAPATTMTTWSISATAIDDAKTKCRRLCDDCANDLKRNAEPKNFRTGIFDVSVAPL